MTTPRVSVVLIFLDAARFLEDAIESVLSQTYDDWELLLVDDGSSDGSTAIASRYVEKHPERMRYLEHEGHANRGMSRSRNLGIREASGEYVAFLDADDMYLPPKLERQSRVLTDHPRAAMVYGATLHWYSWTGSSDDAARDHPRKLGIRPETLAEPPMLVIRFLRHEAWTPGTCGALLRRAVVEQVGGFDERFPGMFEDQAFFYKVCLHWPVYVEAGSWDLYRQHPDQWCERARLRGDWDSWSPNPAQREFLLWVRSYLRERGFDDAELWAALDEQLYPYEHPRRYRLRKLAGRVASPRG
jgi:glycosyltransferase involved in cell wall biosynthesis